MKLFRLDSTVLSFKNNPGHFLNGLTSNTPDTPQNAFLNIHGRIITVFFQVKINEDEIWIVVPDGRIEPLSAHLDRYVKLSQIQVTRLDHGVYFNMEEGGGDPEGAVVIDLPKGEIVISDQDLKAEASPEEFRLYRLKNNIPLQDVDYTDEFILNVGSEGIVSFTKGCFLGQEPISKVSNRSRPTWQLSVEFEDQCDEETKSKMTSKALDPDTNRVLGFVFKRNT